MTSTSDNQAGVLAYADPTLARRRRWPYWLFFSGAAFALLLWNLPYPSRSQSRVTPPEARCANNLRSIAIALIMYANEHKGVYPRSLDEIIVTQDIDGDVFVCPGTTDTPVTAGQPAAVAVTSGGGHLSYIYCGQGLSNEIGPDCIVMAEPLGNHRNPGANIVFANASVQWFPPNEARKVLDQIHSGIRPIRWPRD